MKDRSNHEGERTGSKSYIDVLERRSAPRQQFIADAEIVEIGSGAKLSARSCDLVVHGCYVDTLNPFPVGTLVRIRLKKENTIVEVSGNVVYRMPGLGMGVAFHDLTLESHKTLEQWLSRIHGEHDSPANLRPPLEIIHPSTKQRTTAQFVELVQMLMKKGILNRAEAAGLLRESLDE